MNALCQMTGLNRAGYYRWRGPRQGIPVEMELRDEVQKIALEWPAYGYRRITAELRRNGFEINHKRVLRLMRENALLSPHRRPQGKSSLHDGTITTSRPNEMWGTDGVRIETVDDGWVWVFSAVDH